MNSGLFSHHQANLDQINLEESRVLSGDFWAELRVFLAVAKQKSFSRAAQQLHMSHVTVGRHVRRLEDMIRAQLLVPMHSGVKLTPRGVMLAQLVDALDRQLSDITHDFSMEESNAEGLVRINATEALAALFIVPGIEGLEAANPSLKLHIANPIHMASLKDNQTDILVNFSPENTNGIKSVRCGTVHLIPMAGQEYLERSPRVSLSSIGDHTFIDTSYYMGDAPIWARWRNIIDGAKKVYICDNSFAYSLMIRSGRGIGLLATYALGEKTLIPVDLGTRVQLPIYVHVLNDRLKAKPIRVVHDWIVETFSPRHHWFSPTFEASLFPREQISPLITRVLGLG